jgi:hypothetical protein
MNYIAHPEDTRRLVLSSFSLYYLRYMRFIVNIIFKWRVNYYIRSICLFLDKCYLFLETNIRFNCK